MGPKRRRTGDVYDGEPGATQEHYIPPKRSDIWFDDGSVVLQAENTQFRVHRSMLSRHSEIFRDMFRMPQPSGEAMVEDCPLVVLMDSAEDIKQMLNALYDKAFNSRDALPYEMVAAMIRMGRKYEIPLLRNEGLTRLTLEFPVALSEWEKLPDVFTHIIEGEGLLFDIVQLALENHILTVLPSAYYICSTLPLSSLLDGVDRGEGKPKARLPYEALRACILGRERLLSSLSDNTLAWVPGLGVSEEGCQDPHHCTKLGTNLLKNIWMSEPDSTRTMESWYDFLERCPTATTLCEICLEDAKMIHDAGRRRAWDQLPLAFGLPPWHKLENFAA